MWSPSSQMKKHPYRPTRDIFSTEGEELVGNRIVLCITGSVAAYKAIDLSRLLVKHGAEVFAVMNQRTSEIFLSKEMMKWATGNDVVTELTGNLEHIILSDRNTVDMVIVYPCTANTVGKLACGIDDTVVTSVLTVALGSGIPMVICPAMHEAMYHNRIIQDNITKLKATGVEFLQPRLEQGKAKLVDANDVLKYVQDYQPGVSQKKLAGMTVLITAGSTAEYIDPVRAIMNMSSGKMGMSLAKKAYERGASVTVVYGHGSVDPNAYLKAPGIEIQRVSTAEEMYESVISKLSEKKFDMVILASATSDFSIAKKYRNKIESSVGRLDITLVPVHKIISKVKNVCKYDVFLVGFKAEYNVEPSLLMDKGYNKLLESGADLIVANDVGKKNTGFGSDNNEVYIIDPQKKAVHLPIQSKDKVASKILDLIEVKYRNKRSKTG
ncbi:MAG TPA: bifunctional phosphopantothenoylcysteine decarboxylase/phosphopantothenate--cysteine ligase CoaBC [Nitrososphaeraceae archaeon]|nr:bifunctional phosphopantothenoylcysteine decarboxylase/phosphopantothenate--cysteine ligase CoaBC [Nitrososphaeraceae archaeon]